MKKQIAMTVCTEGATLQGGVALTREDISQMAGAYDPSLYAARLNLEHIKSLWPDSDFRHYGLVKSLRAVELTSGPLKGHLSLEANIELDEQQDARVFQLNRSGQKLFSSIEFYRQFPKTGGTYLCGIALTDTPAALGTQLITLSREQRGLPADAGDACYTTSLETAIRMLSADTPVPEMPAVSEPGFLSRISQLLRGQRQVSDTELKQLRDAVELTANELSSLKQQITCDALTDARLDLQQRTLSELRNELSALKQQLALTADDTPTRPLSTGIQYEQSEF